MQEERFEEPILDLERRIESLSGMGDDIGIRRQREKLERDASDPEIILTVRGVGYRFRER